MLKLEYILNFHRYNKATPAVAPNGYSLESLPAAVNAPLWDSAGQWSFIQPVYLDKYDAGLCAAACDKQTVYDKSQASDDCNYKTCVYANLYILSQDGVPKTVVCALYTESVNSTYAVNKVCVLTWPERQFILTHSLAGLLDRHRFLSSL